MRSFGREHLFWFPSTLADVDYVAERAANLSVDVGHDDDIASDLQLCLTEALNNVVTHSYGSDGTQRIEVRLEMEPDGFRVQISDTGRTICLEHGVPTVADPCGQDQHPEGGYGLGLIGGCTDDAEYARNGWVNVLTLSRNLHA